MCSAHVFSSQDEKNQPMKKAKHLWMCTTYTENVRDGSLRRFPLHYERRDVTADDFNASKNEKSYNDCWIAIGHLTGSGTPTPLYVCRPTAAAILQMG